MKKCNLAYWKMNTLYITEASFTGLFRLIMIILIVYFVFSFLVRVIIPSVMRKTVQNFQKQFFEENPQAKESMKKKEGEVSIKYVNKEKDKKDVDDDDYVDYEEIK